MIRYDVPIPTCKGTCKPHCKGSCKGHRYLVTSSEGFVQFLAHSCVKWGYYFWVGGELEEGADPRFLDHKFLHRYPVERTKSQRWYARHRKRQANLQYLRFERTWVLIAQQGRSPFFAAEGDAISDIRDTPFRFRGYSIGFKGGAPHVAIERDRFNELRKEARANALRYHLLAWRRWFWELPFEAHGGVIDQAQEILEMVNKARKAAGLMPVPPWYVRRHRVTPRVFSEPRGPRGSRGVPGNLASCPRPGKTEE